jgi:hypothetical protein
MLWKFYYVVIRCGIARKFTLEVGHYQLDIFKHTAKKKNKKIKRADQILPEVYGTTLNIRYSMVYWVAIYI